MTNLGKLMGDYLGYNRWYCVTAGRLGVELCPLTGNGSSGHMPPRMKCGLDNSRWLKRKNLGTINADRCDKVAGKNYRFS